MKSFYVRFHNINNHYFFLNLNLVSKPSVKTDGFFYRSVPAVEIFLYVKQAQIPVHLALCFLKLKIAVAKTKKIYTTELQEGVTIIMGSEDRGVNPSVLEILEEKAKLLMFGSIGSLNVSVACDAFL